MARIPGLRGVVGEGRRAPALLLAAVAAAPVLEIAIVARLNTGRWLTGFVSFFSDEVDYWRETATFLASGLGGGHYGWNEAGASATWSHFGPHGPVVELVYGLPGKVFGWSYSTPLYVNLAVFLIALALALALARPEIGAALLIGAVLCTFWPLLLYLPSSLEEPVNQAFAVLLAVLWARVITGTADRRWWAALFGMIVAASLLRVTWALMLIPAALLLMRGRERRTQARMAGGAVVLLVLLFGFYVWTAAPYPLGIDYQIQHAAGLGGKLSRLWHNVETNFQTFLHLRAGDSTTLETLQRFEIVALLIGLAATLVWRRRTRPADDPAAAVDREFALVSGLMLVVLVAATIAVWQVSAYADFRSLAPYVVVILVLGALVGSRPIRIGIALLVVVNLAFVVSYVNLTKQWNAVHFSLGRASVDRAARVFAASIRPGPGSGVWCHTLLWASDYAPPVLLGLPRPMGVMLTSSADRLHPPLRSGWVMLRSGEGSARLRARLRPVGTLAPYGALYANRDVPCA
jgi:hypothetical protein